MFNSKKTRSGTEKQFPGKLHDMMIFVEENGLESIISWELNGCGIQINDPERLVEILPLFFGQTKYRSFRRQLNMWHFHRILEGPNKDIFVHPYFIKHNRDLCSHMSRQIKFKPVLPKEQDFSSSMSHIEPSPIREAQSLQCESSSLSPSQDCAGAASFQASNKCIPSASSGSSIRLPKLPVQLGSATIEDTLKRVENLLNNREDGISANLELPSSLWDGWHDGDPMSFEGKSFFFVDESTF